MGINNSTTQINIKHLVKKIRRDFNKPKTNIFPFSVLCHIIALSFRL
jgi:hypothetical protein